LNGVDNSPDLTREQEAVSVICGAGIILTGSMSHKFEYPVYNDFCYFTVSWLILLFAMPRHCDEKAPKWSKKIWLSSFNNAVISVAAIGYTAAFIVFLVAIISWSLGATDDLEDLHPEGDVKLGWSWIVALGMSFSQFLIL